MKFTAFFWAPLSVLFAIGGAGIGYYIKSAQAAESDCNCPCETAEADDRSIYDIPDHSESEESQQRLEALMRAGEGSQPPE